MAQENQTIEITTELTEQDRRNAMFYNLFFRKKWILGYLIVFVAFSVGVLITKLAGIFNVPTLLCWIAGGFWFYWQDLSVPYLCPVKVEILNQES